MDNKTKQLLIAEIKKLYINLEGEDLERQKCSRCHNLSRNCMCNWNQALYAIINLIENYE